mgnify:CR=1 FL=1
MRQPQGFILEKRKRLRSWRQHTVVDRFQVAPERRDTSGVQGGAIHDGGVALHLAGQVGGAAPPYAPHGRVCFDHVGNYWKNRRGGHLFSHSYEGYRFPQEKQNVLDLIDEGLAAKNMTVVGTTALWMLAAAVASALCAVGNTILAVRVGQSMGADLRSAIVRQVQRFSFGNLDHIQTGQLLVRATSDANQVQTIVQMSVRVLTRAPLWMLGSIVMLILTSPRLALLMVTARTPMRAAASIWLRISASSGDTSNVGPAPRSRSMRVAMK